MVTVAWLQGANHAGRSPGPGPMATPSQLRGKKGSTGNFDQGQER
jgi:hypothetical protein